MIVACIASGPSLTRQDCETVLDAGLTTIAVNSTWKMIPECDHIFAGDLRWWRLYGDSIKSDAQKWCGKRVRTHDVKRFKFRSGGYNSGMRAIELAAHLGADTVVLLGYDCSIRNGLHWHGAHKERNPSNASTAEWRKQFDKLAKRLSGVRIVNCSRYTEITAFERMTLEQFIGCVLSMERGVQELPAAPCEQFAEDGERESSESS